MAARTFRTIIAKALFGREFTALREEFNKLVDEVEEFKGKFSSHTHSAAANAPNGFSGTGGTTSWTSTDAKKIS